MTDAEKALLDIYGPHMDRTHTRAFMAGWDAALENAAKEAEVFILPTDPEPSAAILPAPEPDRPETPS